MKKLSYIAMPMVVTTVSEHLLTLISMMMIGHLGELSLSGAAIATSLTNVTGFSLLFGMSSALETLCGQANGAEQYQMIGTYTYGAIISLLLVCIPISILWIFTEKLLILIGQDPLISHEAGIYSIWLVPTLFPYAILQPLICFLLTQSLIYPMLLSSVATLVFHIPISWLLIFKFEFGTAGAALGISLSYWLNVILLGIYVKYAPSCEKSRISFSKDVFPSIQQFFRFGIPSVVMIWYLEWWSYELVILLSGLLPNPQLETSVLSICVVVSSLHDFIPYSIGAGASTRVSSELGAGHPEAARLAAWVAMFLALIEVIIASAILLSCRSIFGCAFGKEKEVIEYVQEMIPLLSVTMIVDCLAPLFSGVARGVGWQRLGAYVNLGAFYLCGIPMACVLAFVLHWRGKGFWIGLTLFLSLDDSFLRWNLLNLSHTITISMRNSSVVGSLLAYTNAGAALSIGLSYWLNVIILGIYVKYASTCENTRIAFSKDVYPSIREFFRYGIPSAVMICGGHLSLLYLLSGLLPNPQLETSVLTICLLVASLHYNIPYAFSTGASTRVSNELGAGHAEAARLAAWIATFLAVIEAVIASTILLSCRSILGYAFGDEKELVDYVKEMTPFLCFIIMTDSLANMFSGVARGVGWQRLAAYVNLGAFYLCGIPMACILAFVYHWRGKGLWIGLATASLLQSFMLMMITFFTDWKKQARNTRKRIFEGRSQPSTNE